MSFSLFIFASPFPGLTSVFFPLRVCTSPFRVYFGTPPSSLRARRTPSPLCICTRVDLGALPSSLRARCTPFLLSPSRLFTLLTGLTSAIFFSRFVQGIPPFCFQHLPAPAFVGFLPFPFYTALLPHFVALLPFPFLCHLANCNIQPTSFDENKMYHHKESPYSAYGGPESMEATPDTKLTWFSPEDSKDKSYSMTKPTPGAMENVHDPFIATSKPKSEGKLSATASSFEPFGLSFGSLSSTKSMTTMAPKSSAPMPGTTQYLENIIAVEENSPRRRVPPPSVPMVTKSGLFTTETLVSRHIKITSIFLHDIRDRVQASIDVSLLIYFLHISSSPR